VRHLGSLTVAVVLLAIPAFAAAPTNQPAAAKSDPARDAMMAEMMKAGAPGPAHQKLQAMEGRWKAAGKSWLGPGEPTLSEGTAENRG
jgi:hypothetical protein